MDSRRLTLIFAAVAIVVAIALSTFPFLQQDLLGGRKSSVTRVGGPFELVDHEGRRVTEADYRGRHMLIYFGYTYCPDICPTELQVISEAVDLLGPDAPKVQPIFITVDPARDTVDALAQYRTHFHPSLAALTGTEAQIDQAAKAYRVYYAKAKADESNDYLMDHSSFIYLMGPDGTYLTHFAVGTPPEAISERIRETF